MTNYILLNPLIINKPEPILLKNYDAAITAHAINHKTILLAYNPDKLRNILRLVISKNAGKSWCTLTNIKHSPPPSFHSYPYLIRANKNQFILGASTDQGMQLYIFNQNWINSKMEQ